MPPVPLQNSISAFEDDLWRFEVGDQMWSARVQNEDTSLWLEEYDNLVLRAAFFWQWPLIRSCDGSKSLLYQGTPTIWSSCNLLSALTLTISPLLLHPFEN